MIRKETLIAPSLLSADFAFMAEAVRSVEESGAHMIHLDVMDGHFVPNLTFGPKMISDLRPHTRLPMDVHLMLERPERMVQPFAEAGADYISFHLEACTHAHRTVELIRKYGRKPGISLIPSTPVFMLNEMLAQVDLVLVMTVNPGFGGQELIPACLEKVTALVERRENLGLSYLIAVDGGINLGNAALVRQSGADMLIVGSAFFGSDCPIDAVRSLKGCHVV
jgi:ribulose-phosphate 3-epimerase